MIKISKDKRYKLLGIFLYVLISCLVVLLTKPVYILSIIIVLVPPALVNFLWLKKSKKKILVFSIVSTILFAFAAELSSRLANSWDVQSVLPRLFGILPLENILFAFLNIFWVLSFYEYFVDRDVSSKISKKFKYLVLIFSLFSLIVFVLFFNGIDISMNYYFLAIITLLIPSIIIFSKKSSLLKKVLLPVLFFAIIFFIYELIALKIGNWWWPGEYLLPVNLLGQTFPIDDVIIWYFLSTIACIGGYEFFMDDLK